ncbi:MAG: hypothetical protein SCARUB_02357 [Candidatus Scalindua rubra]|uniref:Uncharacterized protein n=1 Tax=Candidatus Scalindua rubra TaxID=1872076 RepID=A0A1E3XA34_9BACT|nr:MAG: hypothetical protein SCARUB_02357 [Candidatus Scalindua rubra]
MIKFGYPDYLFHKNEHLDFSNETLAYKHKIISGDYHIAKEILVKQ